MGSAETQRLGHQATSGMRDHSIISEICALKYAPDDLTDVEDPDDAPGWLLARDETEIRPRYELAEPVLKAFHVGEGPCPWRVIVSAVDVSLDQLDRVRSGGGLDGYGSHGSSSTPVAM